jgi:uncharacterized protein (TIGR02246 family)
MKRGIVVTLVLAATLAACHKGEEPTNNSSASALPTASDEDAIKAVEAAMLAGYKAKDSAKVAAQYADTAVVVVPGSPAIQGHQAVEKSIAESVKDPAFSLDFTNSGTEVAASGDLGYTHGTFRVTFTDPKTKKPVNQAGSYTTVFRKQTDGSWKAVNDIASAGG